MGLNIIIYHCFVIIVKYRHDSCICFIYYPKNMVEKVFEQPKRTGLMGLKNERK